MRISDLKERTVCPASEHHGSPVAEASPGCGRKGAGPSWGKLWDHPLPCLVLGGFQAHGFVCVFTELCPGTWLWEGSKKKGQWEEKERDDALDLKLLEPAAMG